MKFNIGQLITVRVNKDNMNLLSKEVVSNAVKNIDNSEKPLEYFQAIYNDRVGGDKHYRFSEMYRDETGVKHGCKYKDIYRIIKVSYDFEKDEAKAEIVR